MENNFVNVSRTVKNILETHSVFNHKFLLTKRVLFGTIILLYYSPNRIGFLAKYTIASRKNRKNYPYCSYFLLSPSSCVSI